MSTISRRDFSPQLLFSCDTIIKLLYYYYYYYYYYYRKTHHYTLYYYYFQILFTKMAYPQLAKAKAGHALNSQITKKSIQSQKFTNKIDKIKEKKIQY